MGKLIERKHDLFKDGLSGGYTYDEIVADGVTSDPVSIHPTGRGNTSGVVILRCGANQGKMQAFFGEEKDIVTASDDEWFDWSKFDDGVYTGTIFDVFDGPLTALRCVSISGEITFSILI